MRAYGLDKYHMRGCCPGHDTFPREKYESRRSDKAHSRDTKIMRRMSRRNAKLRLQFEARAGE